VWLRGSASGSWTCRTYVECAARYCAQSIGFRPSRAPGYVMTAAFGWRGPRKASCRKSRIDFEGFVPGYQCASMMVCHKHGTFCKSTGGLRARRNRACAIDLVCKLPHPRRHAQARGRPKWTPRPRATSSRGPMSASAQKRQVGLSGVAVSPLFGGGQVAVAANQW